MKNKNVLGGILASIAALMGIIGHFVIFLNWYQIGMHTQSAEPGCEILLKYIHPLMADVGIMAGVLFAVSAYGFFTKRNWAFFVTMVALVLALLGSWFINVPLHGCRSAACLLPALLAVSAALLPVPEARWEDLLEPDPALIVNRRRLHLLLDERRFQHQPDHHPRRSDLRPRCSACTGWR